jgi:energy-coupling factor transporter ATP-binding protein EcfA2
MSFSYEEKSIFEKSDFTINKNEKVIIYANNGSGKTTFLNICAGFLSPFSGTYFRKNELKIGYLFQNPYIQNISITVEEELVSVCKNYGMNDKVIDEKVSCFLGIFGLNHLRKRDIVSLSGGEKQIISFLSNLIMEPDIIFFDEPFSMIDSRARKRLIKILNNISKLAFIIVTSLYFPSLNVSDQYIIDNKKILKISDNPEHDYFLKRGIFPVVSNDQI